MKIDNFTPFYAITTNGSPIIGVNQNAQADQTVEAPVDSDLDSFSFSSEGLKLSYGIEPSSSNDAGGDPGGGPLPDDPDGNP